MDREYKNQSIIRKSGYRVESGRSRSGSRSVSRPRSRVECRRSSLDSRSVSRPRSRVGSRDRCESSLWTDNEDDNEMKRVKRGKSISFGEKMS